jgi:multidrug efflux pump subunit AcrB
MSSSSWPHPLHPWGIRQTRGGSPRFFLALNPEQPDPAFAKIIAVTGSAAERERVIAALHALAAEGAFPEARLRVTTLLFGPPVPWPVAFRVLGPDPNELRRIAEEVRRVMARHPNVLDPHLDWGPRSAEPRLVMDEARLAGFGLTAADLAQQLEAALVGSRVSEARIGTRSVAIMLRGARRTPDEIESLPIAVPGAGTVPLLQLGRIELDFTDPVLKRLNRQPVLRVQADPAGSRRMWRRRCGRRSRRCGRHCRRATASRRRARSRPRRAAMPRSRPCSR